MNPNTQTTHALNLSGGGARGAYQAGVLCGISDYIKEDFPFQVITGVSAGAINAAPLAASTRSFKEECTMLADTWRKLKTESIFNINIGSLSWSMMRWMWMLTSGQSSSEVKALFNTTPLSRFLRSNFNPEGIQTNINVGRLKALGVTTTCYNSGETITFVQGCPELKTWKRVRRLAIKAKIDIDHIMASAALPILFPAIPISGGYYGDGSIRQYSPLSPAIHLGADKILVISLHYNQTPSRSQHYANPSYPTPAQILGMILHGVFLDALDNDVERLERINASVKQGQMTHPIKHALRPIELLKISPSVDLGRLAYDYRKLLPYTIRQMTKGLGSSSTESSDFMSFLLFERPYLEKLLDLGYNDAKAHIDNIKKFFES